MSGCSRAFLLVVLGLFFFSSVLAHDDGLHQGVIVNVQSVTPTQTHFRGKDIVTITGFGFRTYSKVQCIWDSQFASFSAVIVDDRTIQCETPVIDKSEFVGGVPHISSLALIFDGTDDLLVDVIDNFVFGPSLTSFTPSTGKVAGGGTFTITGSFFSDFTDVSVWFDTTQCAGAKIRSDTQITCTIPSGEFNQNAAISVIFDNDPNLYLHFPTTYHYGPEITVVVPPCGNYAGGTRVTMVGNNFDDPVVSSNAAPLLVAPIIEVVYNNKRYFGTDVSFDGQQIQWTTPQIDQDVFGQDVDVYVHFKGVNSKVSQLPVFSFRYGPIVYNEDHLPPFFNTSLTYQNPFPSSGHRSGGDIIVIEGCGFSSFTTGQISPLIYTGVSTTRELCFRGPNGPGGVQDTLTITNCGANSFGCERLLCFTAPFDCTDSGSLDHQLEVRFRPTTGGVFQSSYVLPPADEAELFFAQGPIVSSIDKVRGPWNGGQNVTVFGDNFFSNGFTGTPAEPGWTITAILDSPDLDDPLTAPVKVLSDEKMSFITPAGLFGLDVSVSFNFDTCTDIPRNGSLSYHFGPSCSSLQPTNDWLSGNRQVGVSGVGFLEDGLHTASNINVEVCLHRLNAFGGVCDVHEPVARQSITATGTSVVFTTPPLRQNVPTNVGGNRLFGDKAGIYVVFENVPESSLLDGDDEARLFCGDYRFGPVVSSLSPNKGPVGPRGDKSPATKVTIAGTAFNDPEYNKNLAVGIFSGNFVNEGLIFGGDARVDGVNDVLRNKQITFTTRWGGESNTDVGVITFFDTCNTTVSSSTVSWGPVINQLVGPDGRTPLADGNADLHLYGLLPEGGQDIQVIGEGFDEFDAGQGRIDAQCYIDGVPVATFFDEDDDSIHCLSPARDFNTTAILAIEFGRICNSEEEDIDFKQRVVATQKLIYSPRIVDFSPSYGLTSGGTTVVISGEGFNGWDSYICYFGHYTNGVQAVISDDGRTVTCDTPIHRGEFNTDVTVHVELEGIFSEKAVAARKFHYGPICTDITPDNDVVLGGRAANLVGDGFIDCTYEEDAPFTNCTFTTFDVRFGDISNGKNANASITNVQQGTVGITIPSTLKGCQDEPTVALYFPDVVVTNESQRWVVCSNPARPYFFHYGPLFVSQSSEFHRNSISYGWENTEVTITGQNFNDPSLGAPNCLFGGRTATVVSVTDTTIICAAPANDWNALVNVTVEFPSSGNLTGCLTSNKKVLVAQKFHYGPVIDSISPEFGYVAGDDPVEITGFAFGCCGITQWNCMFPQPANTNFTSYPTTRSGDSVTCNVPENDAIDLVLNNIGVFFTGPNFAANFSYQTLTEANTSLHYYYGPIVTRVTPTRASLSARDDFITFEGFGFTDPYLDPVVYCDYFSISAGGFNDTQVASAVTDTSITCPIATFNHRCGAIDKVRPRWTRGDHTQLRPNFGSKYVKTEPVTPQPPRRVLPFTSDGGSNRESSYGPINYGPAILSVTAEVGQLPTDNPSGSLRSWTQGGLQLEIEFDDIQDWYSGEDTQDFGREIALCVFGNRGAVSFSPIEDGDNTISCTVPSGAFGDSGVVRVILDPHFDIGTTFSPALHSDYWHWMPYVEGVSRRFVTPLGYETVVISGSGFCNYDTVVCNFGGVEGYQGDVVNDYFVLCSTPRRGPGDAPITLDFCDNAFCDNNLSGPLSSENTISVPGNFTVAGITDLQPREGPKCGGTTLHITGYGFHLFDSVICRFDGDAKKERTGRVVNPNTIECVTVDFSPYSDTDPVTCVTVEVVGHFPKLGDILMRSPFTFELGAPNTVSVNPASAWLERSTEVVVIGEYLNGGATPDEGGVYFCKFGDFPQVPASIHRFEEDDEEEHSALVCDSPTIFDNPDMTIGTYDLEIYFDCFEGKYTFNRLPFTFYQTPSISRYTPFEGPEVGGTLVTVEGDFLAGGSGYFCSFGTLDIDNQIVGAVFDPINNEIVCYSPAKIVKQSTLVDFAISIDGGATWVTANSPYRYNDIQVVCEKQEDAASSLSPSMIALLSTFFFAAFMAMML